MRVLLVVYDNGSFIHWFPLGLAYVAASLRKAGHDVVIYNKDQYHYPPEHLTQILDNNKFDAVGLGFVAGYWQYKEALSISKAINASKQRPRFGIGGHGPSPEPEYFKKVLGADHVTCGEFEKENIDDIPFPAWDLFPIDYYALIREPHCVPSDRVMPVITSRGCPFKCNFCYRMQPKVRLRSPESVVEEIKQLKRDYGITYIAFQDDLFMMSSARAIEISEAIMDLGMKWNCFGRLNYASREVIKAMKKAGCVYIGYGIESLDDTVLKNMNKNLTVEQIEKGIKITKEEGISPGFNIIWGNIGDTEETLQKAVDFLLKHDDQSQLRTIRPVTPYPGSPLYYKAIEMGLLEGVEDFYENKHVNSDLLTVNFTDLSDDDFYQQLHYANCTLLGNYHGKQLKQQIRGFIEAYFNNVTSFRGLRQT